jgi:membrane protease YdiL (CAAX protease family)
MTPPYTLALTTPHPITGAVLAGGIVVAAAAWGIMFAGGRRHFWARAAGAALAVAAYAVAAEPATAVRLFDRSHWAGDVLVGVGSGVALYAVFWVGEQLLVVLLPSLAVEVADLYDVRGEGRRWWIPLVVAMAAPAEELFFRGFLQEREGWAVALAVYAAVHLWERKPILVLAALAGGAAWGLLLTWTGGLVAPVVSHLVWAEVIIWWRPARPSDTARRARNRLVSARRRR